MLTRLEVDGFKNLLGFTAEFGPFTCIAGANAVGKSNLFDAIEFLSLLADYDVDEAAARLRGGSEEADARSLFSRTPGQQSHAMRIAVEMIVGRNDDVSGDMRTPILRYEVIFEFRAPTGSELVGKTLVWREWLGVVPPERAAARLRFGAGESLIDYSGYSGDAEIFVAAGPSVRTLFRHVTERRNEQPAIERSATEHRIERAQYWLFAIRRELQSWRRLALEPSAMRKPDRFKAPQRLAVDGSHLAATLYRITHQDGINPADAYAEIASRVSELTPIHDIRIDRDDKRELLTLEAELRQTGWVDARALSEGTLRFLALASLALDPDAPRLVCIEEPENGIHPAVVAPLAELLRTTARAPQRQIIVNTHSPVFVRHVHAQAPEDLVMAKLVGITSPEGRQARALRVKPLVDTWRCHDDVQGVGLSALLDYLELPQQEGG